METPTISIVMPAYNVAPYIAKAIECVQSQTYGDWELIIVDDAAQDDTLAIAQNAARGDERIRIVRHEQNRGLSAARNTGMAHARGAYLWFCDPDDTYDAGLLETCMESQAKHPAQVTMFGVVEEYYDEGNHFLYDNRIVLSPAYYRTAEALRPHVLEFERDTCLGYAWNKLYRTDYLQRIHAQFETVPLIEDIVFNIQVFQNLETLTTLFETPYRYARRLHTNLTSGHLEGYDGLMRRRIQMLRDQQESWGLLDSSSKAVLGSLMARYVLSAAERNCAPEAHMSGADRRRWCEAVFADPLFRELIPYAQADSSKALQMSLKPLKKRDVSGTLRLGSLIHIARTHFLPAFTKVKSGR